MGYLLGGYNGHIRSPSLLNDQISAAVHGGLIGGQIHVAEIPDAGIVGAAMWFGPGEALYSTYVALAS